MRIGVDLGGTKIEAIALDDDGRELGRHRIQTPRFDYRGSIDAIVGLVERLERETGQRGSVGVGMPGALSPVDGRVKNANSTWLNGTEFDRDLAAALGRPAICVNDANCLAVSEATDGAAAGAGVVFAAILGTGVGAGIALFGRAHVGGNAIGGEWGHNPLPWPREDELPGPDCYCGKTGCIETWVSGTGLQNDYRRVTGEALPGREIVARSEAGDPAAGAALARYEDRRTRALASIIDVLDPDVVVFGGGMSNVERLYRTVPEALPRWVFGGECATPVRKAVHGDSSGVRGAAWLWPSGEGGG
ncbi:MAG: fructokinase [Inquilinus sp.]|nr:fructokinase [Inquilinus sp.]